MFVQGPAINNDSGSAVRGYFTSVGYTESESSPGPTLAAAKAENKRHPATRAIPVLREGKKLYNILCSLRVN
jgi:hypothetical protein